jgi:hypothetical protein
MIIPMVEVRQKYLKSFIQDNEQLVSSKETTKLMPTLLS